MLVEFHYNSSHKKYELEWNSTDRLPEGKHSIFPFFFQILAALLPTLCKAYLIISICQAKYGTKSCVGE